MVILTGFYNGENYIERCLTTILNQKYKDLNMMSGDREEGLRYILMHNARLI